MLPPFIERVASRWASLAFASSVVLGCSSAPSVPVGGDVSGPAEGPAVAVPEPVRTSYDSALEAMAGDDPAEAELILETIVLEYPEYPGPYVNLSILYLQDDRAVDARAALDTALSLDPEHAVTNNQLGILLRTQGQFHEAEAAYRRAIQADPDYPLPHYNLGVLLDLYLHRPDEALQHYETYRALTGEPNTTVDRWIVDLRRRLHLTDPQVDRGDDS